MRTLILILIASILFAAKASAQQTIAPINKEYLDSTQHVLPSAAGAFYRRETEKLDSVKGVVRTFFIDGRRQSVSEVEIRKHTVPNGTFESWFGNGQLSHHEVFDHGKRVGEMRLYYPNGQLKHRATYTTPFESTGECFLADGQAVPFFEYEQMPVYSQGDGGNRAVVAAIQQGVKYPRDALRARASGRVFVSFTVNSKGEVADTKVIKGVFPSLDEAVLQAVQRLKPFKPGQQDGRPVSVSFTVPVTFAIQ
ncbi:MAG: hypothetical protein JWR44_1102 [Hymenobacter sp.]|jgi:protein TonB|nr:hypothetical protein [Hymenobacter sp.]